MSDKNTGTGRISPLDASEFAEISISAENGVVTSVSFNCTDDEYLADCCGALQRLLPGFPLADIMQMNGAAVIYNTEKELPREKLYLASMAVSAAKRAAEDYAGKNGITLEGGVCRCGG